VGGTLSSYLPLNMNSGAERECREACGVQIMNRLACDAKKLELYSESNGN
jgi:hypothetical protein